MPSILMYCSKNDIPNLLELFKEDVGFIVPDGTGRWRAKTSVELTDTVRMALWHIPSGPLPLVGSFESVPDDVINDPWSGWVEKRASADPSVPYFGPGHPGIYWLTLNLTARDPGSSCGMSSIEWIGNHYSSIGSIPSSSTGKHWERLKRQIGKRATKVPRGGTKEHGKPEIWAFPVALENLDVADVNP